MHLHKNSLMGIAIPKVSGTPVLFAQNNIGHNAPIAYNSQHGFVVLTTLLVPPLPKAVRVRIDKESIASYQRR